MTKNTRQHAAKKTVAKKAGKADRLKLRKRAQTEDVTARLDKDLELVCSVGDSCPVRWYLIFCQF